ncbi:hypothetical protein BGZ50_003494 [Haplosporangium sp. Z 11]|nr:hypothetical protein BGZ50_003494 [Haplosporangium sp. Z 11]
MASGTRIMVEEVKDFAIPGGILGDLIVVTPRDNISCVLWKDQLVEAWYNGRAVLISDTAHKA